MTNLLSPDGTHEVDVDNQSFISAYVVCHIEVLCKRGWGDPQAWLLVNALPVNCSLLLARTETFIGSRRRMTEALHLIGKRGRRIPYLGMNNLLASSARS